MHIMVRLQTFLAIDLHNDCDPITIHMHTQSLALRET
jgi:hypothetical protein